MIRLLLVWLLSKTPLSAMVGFAAGESSKSVNSINSSSSAIWSLEGRSDVVVPDDLPLPLLVWDTFEGIRCVMESSAYSTSFSPDRTSSVSISFSSIELVSSKSTCVSAAVRLLGFPLSSVCSDVKSSSFKSGEIQYNGALKLQVSYYLRIRC